MTTSAARLTLLDVGPASTARHERGPARVAPLDDLCRRIRGEFREMPGLCLTLPQAARLFNLPPHTCVAALQTLVERRLLYMRRDGRYANTQTAV